MLPLGLPIKEITRTISIPEIALFVPWDFMPPAGPAIIAYPLIPWLGITLAGMALGHLLVDHGEKVLKKMHLVGGALLIAFVAVRFSGVIGNINNLKPQGLISFLSITKYPPSLAFVLLTFGIVCLIMAAFNRFAPSLGDTNPLIVFGRVPFFYYMLHLTVFCVLCSGQNNFGIRICFRIRSMGSSSCPDLSALQMVWELQGADFTRIAMETVLI